MGCFFFFLSKLFHLIQQHFKDHFVQNSVSSEQTLTCAPSGPPLLIVWFFCKTGMDFTISVLCLAPLFEFRGCWSTDCGLEWSGFRRTLPLLPTSCVWPPGNHATPSSSAPSFSPLPPDKGACGGNGVGSCWGSQTAGGMTAAAGRVAVLRTCEPWMSLFHMALACRVTRNAVMTAVIAHTVVLTTHPHPNNSPEEEWERGEQVACI